jgi:hypothetical protein
MYCHRPGSSDSDRGAEWPRSRLGASVDDPDYQTLLAMINRGRAELQKNQAIRHAGISPFYALRANHERSGYLEKESAVQRSD